MSSPLLNNRYLILKSLGEGGFGKTYLAEDTQMPSRRRCVIKQLKPVSDRPEVFALLQQRFAREAAVIESVGKGHDQIPDLYAYFEIQGQFYLVQEWIEGNPLTASVQSVWPEKNVSEFLVKVLPALAHVHQQNIIHRDIKPANVILRTADQLPCLIDFGAVKELMTTTLAHQASSIAIGTPGFMPSEQAIGRPTFASDIYSLAMTAIYLLTGRSPNELPSDRATGRLLWQSYAPDTSNRLAGILTRATDPAAQYRFPTAADMLQAVESSTTTSANPNEAFVTLAPPTPAAPAELPAKSQPVVVQTADSEVVNTHSRQPRQSQPVRQPTKQFLEGLFRKSFQQSYKGPFLRAALAVGGLAIAASVLLAVRPKLEDNLAPVAKMQAQVETLEKQVERQPNNRQAQLDLTEAYTNVGDYDKAQQTLDSLLAKNLEEAEGLWYLGTLQSIKGEYQTAVETISQALEVDSKNADIWIARGQLYTGTGQYEKALADYNQALEIDSDAGDAEVGLGSIHFIRGELEQALEKVERAIEKEDTSLVSAYVMQGNIFSELEQTQQAKAAYEAAAAIAPKTSYELANQGHAYFRLGETDNAEKTLSQAIAVNDNFPDPYVYQSSLEYSKGNGELAMELMETALAIQPRSFSALSNMGLLKSLPTNLDWASGIEFFTKALAINPNHPGILHQRSLAYFQTQSLDQAIADCTQGLSINPHSVPLRLQRAQYYALQNQPEPALEDFNRVIDTIQETGLKKARLPVAYQGRASVRSVLNDREGALADLNQAVELAPGEPIHYVLRGQLRTLLGDRTSGKADLEKAIELYQVKRDSREVEKVRSIMRDIGD